MFDKILNFFGLEWVRNRDAKGRYIPDNKKSKFINEAWTIKFKKK